MNRVVSGNTDDVAAYDNPTSVEDEASDNDSSNSVLDMLNDVECARRDDEEKGCDGVVVVRSNKIRFDQLGNNKGVDRNNKLVTKENDDAFKRNGNRGTTKNDDDDVVENTYDDDCNIPEPVSLHRTQALAAPVTPGAIRIRPNGGGGGGRSSLRSTNDETITEGGTDRIDDDAYRVKSILELEAELVVAPSESAYDNNNNNNNNIQVAQVKPTNVIAHAEPIDEELLRRIQNESSGSNDNGVQGRKKKKKEKKRLIAILLCCVILLLILAISIGVGIFVAMKNGNNNNNNSNENEKQLTRGNDDEEKRQQQQLRTKYPDGTKQKEDSDSNNGQENNGDGKSNDDEEEKGEQEEYSNSEGQKPPPYWNGQNGDSDSQEQDHQRQPQYPYGQQEQQQNDQTGGFRPNLSDFLHVTQHALLVDVKTDCTDLTSIQPPYVNMRIQCGNTDVEDGVERIRSESTNDNVSCSTPKGNSLECQATISPNTTRTFYGIIFTCGNDHTMNSSIPFNSATVQMLPLTGSNCTSYAKQSLTMARFCGKVGEEFSPQKWQLVPAVHPGSCLTSTERSIGNWTVCQSSDSCDGGVSPCETNLNEIIAYDKISSEVCENPGGTSNRYLPPDTPVFWNQMNSIFSLMNNV